LIWRIPVSTVALVDRCKIEAMCRFQVNHRPPVICRDTLDNVLSTQNHSQYFHPSGEDAVVVLSTNALTGSKSEVG
jgi:hypothetical protein